jgi:hypothetical protein
MARILLRFNTKFEQDSKGRTWRVLEDGIERLASKVFIHAVDGQTIQEDVDGVPKYHLLFNGGTIWENDEATIISNECHESLKNCGRIS